MEEKQGKAEVTIMKKIWDYIKPFWLFVLVFVILLIIDLVTKHVFIGFEERTFIPRVISIHYTQNRGVAFGWLYGAGIWLILLTAFLSIVGFAFYIFYRRVFIRKSKKIINCDKENIQSEDIIPNKSLRRNLRLFDVAFAFFLAGALGNLVDRIFLGYVRDFLRFDFMNFPVFNLADVFINVGVLMIAIFFAIEIIKDFKKEKALKKSKQISEVQDGKD